MIYLDYSATTPISDLALKTYMHVSTHYFGNASSLHTCGTDAASIIESARSTIASLLSVTPRSIYFTGCGSEANSSALIALAKGNGRNGKQLVTTPLEHPSVLQTFAYLESQGFTVSKVRVNEYGQVCLSHLRELLQEKTVLVSIGHASAELGTIQDLESIGDIVKEHGALFHSDCVQTFGKVMIPVKEAHLDSFSISSHKVYGPKGAGACYISPQTSWDSFFPHTSHEKGLRPGTVDTAGIAAFAAAAEETYSMQTDIEKKVRKLSEYFTKTVLSEESIILEGHPDKRIPGHFALRFDQREGQYIMLELNRRGIAVSTGSACRSGSSSPPASMIALGRSSEEAHGLIRLSMGKFTTRDDIEKAVEIMQNLASREMTGGI
ncbi:cysteine desulfurase family protein [Thalassorhabdus alkalitolerans]|uniref:Cysteine desulfurase family protein n=1 Tax=Thalassorhabdus alkalitolerans TaxID=2282697 RepID=A0ABW0YQS4_9BACI